MFGSLSRTAGVGGGGGGADAEEAMSQHRVTTNSGVEPKRVTIAQKARETIATRTESGEPGRL